MEDGTDIKWADTVEFTFPIQGGRVIKVYDGDTITIATKLPYKDSPLYRFPIRLKGIDTAEIKSKNENEKKNAKIARDALSELILHKNVLVKNMENETKSNDDMINNVASEFEGKLKELLTKIYGSSSLANSIIEGKTFDAQVKD